MITDALGAPHVVGEWAVLGGVVSPMTSPTNHGAFGHEVFKREPKVSGILNREANGLQFTPCRPSRGVVEGRTVDGRVYSTIASCEPLPGGLRGIAEQDNEVQNIG